MPLEATADLETTLTEAIKVEVARVCEENQRILEALERENSKSDMVRSRVREQTDRTAVQQQAIQRLLDLQLEESGAHPALKGIFSACGVPRGSHHLWWGSGDLDHTSSPVGR